MDYQGGNYYFQALSGLGQDFQKAIERHKELEKQKEFADDTIGYMARNPKMAAYLMNEKDSVPQDALNRYHAASVSQKTSMATAALANMNMDMKRQEMEQKQEDMKAQAEERKATAQYRLMMARQMAQQPAQPHIAQLPNPSGGQPLNVIENSKGGIQQIRQPAIKSPKLNKDESSLLSWAQNRSPSTPDKSKLPEDLQPAYDWAAKNPQHPQSIHVWNKIKAEIIKRSTAAPQQPEIDPETTDQ